MNVKHLILGGSREKTRLNNPYPGNNIVRPTCRSMFKHLPKAAPAMINSSIGPSGSRGVGVEEMEGTFEEEFHRPKNPIRVGMGASVAPDV